MSRNKQASKKMSARYEQVLGGGFMEKRDWRGYADDKTNKKI